MFVHLNILTMMSCQMKNTLCQWHSFHKVLVIRFSSTNQPSYQQSQGTQRTKRTPQTQETHRHQCAIHLASNKALARYNNQTLHQTVCRHRTFLSPPDVNNTKVVHRCLSTTPPNASATKKFKYNPLMAKSSRYVITPELASLMVDKIWQGRSVASSQELIVDVNPGPGHIVTELLNRGAKKVLAVEKRVQFMDNLHTLAQKSNGRLTAMHANYFMPSHAGNSSAPKAQMDCVFEGVQPQPWEATDPEFPVTIIGALPTATQELKHAVALVKQIMYRQRAFKYGRVQHNLIMSYRAYRKLVQEPGYRLLDYTSLTAMYQLCCHVNLLHMEPQSSFNISNAEKKKPSNLCLVQVTPKIDLSQQGLLAEEHTYLFIHFLIQMLVNRTTSLKDKIESWAPGHSDIIFDFDYDLKTKTGDLNGTDYLHLFNAIRKMDTFSEWMGTHFYNTNHVREFEPGGNQEQLHGMDYEQLLDRIELHGVSIDDVEDETEESVIMSTWLPCKPKLDLLINPCKLPLNNTIACSMSSYWIG